MQHGDLEALVGEIAGRIAQSGFRVGDKNASGEGTCGSVGTASIDQSVWFGKPDKSTTTIRLSVREAYPTLTGLISVRRTGILVSKR